MGERVTLRDMQEDDLGVLFEHQLDPVARHMAAFTAKDPLDRDTFLERWRKILADDAIIKRTVVLDGIPIGMISRFERQGDPEVTYWLGREHWNKGFATQALSQFLDQSRRARPTPAPPRTSGLDPRAEKCGFVPVGESASWPMRGEEIDEVVYRFEGASRRNDRDAVSPRPLFFSQALVIVGVPYLIWHFLGLRSLIRSSSSRSSPACCLALRRRGAEPRSLEQRFLKASVGALSGLAWLAVVMFSFLSGTHLDFGQLRRARAGLVLISSCSALVPFLLGSVAGLAIAALFRKSSGRAARPDISRWRSACARRSPLPVLAAILRETGCSATG